MKWRQLQEGEFWKSGYKSGTLSWRLSGGKLGYALKLRLKNHRHCKCFRSKPVLYVAEHHPATGDFPIFFTALNYSARQFLLSNPDLEICINEKKKERNEEGGRGVFAKTVLNRSSYG